MKLIFLDKVNSGQVDTVKAAVSTLQNAGYFSIALELAILRSGDLQELKNPVDPILQRGYLAGYKAAIDDLFNFETAVKVQTKAAEIKNQPPDYGAREVLKSQGYTEKEIDDAIKAT